MLEGFLNTQVLRGGQATPTPATTTGNSRSPTTPPPTQPARPPAPSLRPERESPAPRVFPAHGGDAYPYTALLGQRFVEGEAEVEVQWASTWEPIANLDSAEVAALQR
ncbi:hypothetical protein PHYPSEUDO_006053 [Phytophthora pseudosyringae]|uniref:Uncharacterized protein n=1 Tax=Phytophthora pseudosyringae TaxID=221518 RepID=A0A8T1VJD8_9STRA|nr:hypothetical protein PHYPSEUDO_006053 [Phytophthora pseudosyringae]